MKAGRITRMIPAVLAGTLLLSPMIAVAGEKIDGMVVALRIDKCGMKPGTCEGSVGIGMPGQARTLRVRPGTTTIKKGGRVVVLQELKLGDRAVAELESKDDGAKSIDAQ